MAVLYRCQGWRVKTNVTVAGCQIDLIAEKKIAGIAQVIAVECTLEYVTARKFAADFTHLIAIRTQNPSYRLCIVSARGFSRGVKDRAQVMGIDLLTHQELQEAILGFDTTHYAKSLIEAQPWVSCKKKFITQTLTWDSTYSECQGTLDAFDILHQWIGSNTKRVLMILGDYGTGKTTLCHAFSARLAENHLINPHESPMPLLIELRTVKHCARLVDALFDHLKLFGISDPNLGVILSLLDEGALVLLLDGLDEFVAEYDLPELTRILLEFTLHQSTRAKVIITCRTHYFRSAFETAKTFFPDLQDSNKVLVSPLYRELSSRHDYGIVYLDMFTDAMVEKYLRTTLGLSAKELQERLPWLFSLKDLLTRPILLDMMVQTLPQLEGVRDKITEYDLYDIYTRMWAKRDAWRRSWTIEARLSFVRFLAFSLFVEGKDCIHYEPLLDQLKAFYQPNRDIRQEELIIIETDARTATFLVRDSEGNYRFAHSSFYEFFLAQYVIEAIDAGRGRDLCARIYPKWLPLHAAQFIKTYLDTGRLQLNKMLPTGENLKGKRNIVLWIDDSQCGSGHLGDVLRDNWVKYRTEDTILVCVPDSISGLLYSFYLLPLAIMHDNMNVISGPEFVKYYKAHLAPLGIFLILCHASFPTTQMAHLLAEGTVIAEIRKPGNNIIERINNAVRLCLERHCEAQGISLDHT